MWTEPKLTSGFLSDKQPWVTVFVWDRVAEIVADGERLTACHTAGGRLHYSTLVP